LVLTSKKWHDLHSKEYDTSYEGIKWVEIYDKITWEKTIRPYLPHDKFDEILDAGGGTGKWTIHIAKLGYEVTLIDNSKDMLRVADQKLTNINVRDRIRIIESDITNLMCLKKILSILFYVKVIQYPIVLIPQRELQS